MAMKPGIIEWGAAGWGFAEATLFFLVPDIWLTTWAAHAPRRAFIACVFALLGALVGGAIMYGWGAADHDAATATVQRVPAISAQMVAETDSSLRDDGAVALFAGVFRGRPYKLFAVTAGAQQFGLLAYLLVSVPARLLRFVILTAATILAVHYSRRWLRPRVQTLLILGGWAVFYSWFFATMPN